VTTPRCLVCRSGWGDWFPCRLSDEANPEDWIQVHICTGCWEAAQREHEAQLRERERQLLREWFPPHEEASA
jgi:hypothetical protein